MLSDTSKRILLVEDNPGDAILIKAILQDAPKPGFDLVWMKSLGAALQALEQVQVDAILLDLSLPDTQGMETLAKVHAHSRSVPIVVLTGLDDERLASKAVNEGAQDYLAKGELSPGMLLRALSYAMDRQRREMALRDSESLFRVVANSAPVLLWLSDELDQAAFFNHTWFQFTGRFLIEEAGKGWLNGVHPQDRPEFERAQLEAKEHRTGFEAELRLRRMDGEYRWILLTCAPRIAENGVFLGYIASGLDLTEHRRAEETLRQAQKLEGLGLLAGGIAHDFNNLLAAILGNVEVARSESESFPPVHPYLDSIEAATHRAADLTRQMLAYSGKGVIQVERLDLNPLVWEIGDLLRAAMSKKIIMDFDLAEGLPEIEGDVTQIQQVVMNLVTNASDAIGDREGRILLRTCLSHLEPQDDPGLMGQSLQAGPYVMLEVEDSGCGMPAEVIERIFDPFYTTKATGRGLGLSAVQGILKSHGGGLRIRSLPGRGTTFQVFIPAQRGHEISATPPTEDIWVGSGLALVVDDEPIVREVTATLLGFMGYEVLTAQDGQEALELFEQNRERLRLILMDMSMPRLNGLEAARNILQRDPSLPIVLCSGYPAEIYGLEAVPLSGFLQKPYRRADLIRALRNAFGPRT